MNKEEIYKLINSNPVFFLGTIDEGQPRVRGMLLYKADDNAIIFHTASCKELYKQILKNSKVELCFNCNGTQIRINGNLNIVDDNILKNEIYNHPTRKFLHVWKESGQFNDFF
ncbi:pyridoxine/pyridoxamine 5'-phosphate oxidase [Clostridium saccharobutylicum]|uniref:pyridoxamine 5'-phosphate oxidase family protein n=1 Tax=Clostridium saccharobutylicum TaxID=169679 RepID=UPI000983E082|nr:pyridoxamine 5'-phosphate oxidase family protein [Clostridium saccharobutylicum]AQS09801.1 pyridoxine/pyridoxamine 5'-phosphate oxidase [Clostridium saccharobutylicum]NSB90667.1 putative pyridoxamine 5'-phosphate oxidase family protein [Clostridium saccharobutylicum]NYC27800.1 putative pyridoxamine 5'-phosphate oxidase family protein [Clostridium saccharobutylicum]OOM15341.1 pyridoxine/pyridoxamine 5'-phosphate oxidase [Clostridium saccharobutylicum]